MTGDQIVALFTALFTTMIAIVTIAVRADVSRLKAEIVSLNKTIADMGMVIGKQNTQIESMAGYINDLVSKVPISPIERIPSIKRPSGWKTAPEDNT